MNKNYKICICLCEEISNARFFLKMKDGMFENGIDLYFLVTDLSVYVYLKNLNIHNLFLIKRHTQQECYSDIKITKEVVEHSLSFNESKILYQSTYYSLKNICNKEAIYLILASQGIKSAELAARDFAKNNDIKIGFYELANIPGKIFFDKEGSNAVSWLYKNINELDNYNIEDLDYMEWKRAYLAENFRKHLVKQSVNLKELNWKYGFISRIGFLYTGVRTRRFDLISKLLKFLKVVIMEEIRFDVFYKDEKYIFFPMQVSNDSQILINSNIKLFEALRYCIKKSKEENLALVVKLHPAEPDIDTVKKVLKMRSKYGFKIVNENTFNVIANAEKVITINSTVALEAMIIGKRVEILGKSYYRFFNEQRLKNYILGYLYSLDYFKEKEYTKSEISNLLSGLVGTNEN